MRGTKFKIWTMLSLILLIFVASSDCNIGDACSHGDSCGFISHYYKCEDEHCQCSEPKYLKYDESTVTETCTFSFLDIGICSNSSCPAHSSCIKNRICECNEGYVKIVDKCKKENRQDVLQRCYTANDDVFLCDISEHSVCRSGKCVCFDKYFPNTTSGKCEHQSSYLKLHGLSEYRVKPGVYCKKESHCISGLKCKNFKCSCPSGCTYESSKEVCDCGEEPRDTTVAPIIVGCILAAIIIMFWFWKIKKTVERLQEKKIVQTSSFSTVPHESPIHNSYNLAHTRSPSPALSQNTNAHSVPPTGLYVNNPSGNGRQSPVFPPEAEPVPAKIAEPNSINLPGITPYPSNPTEETPDHINQPGAPYPNDSSYPPPYSSTATLASLPYSINPPPVSDPYPSGSSSTPYPTNPSTTPFPSNPSASHYPSNPSAPPNLLNTYDTPYPCNPHVTPSSPYHEPENSTAPPAYNPAYVGEKI